ncbi:DUF4124 domain-containing protein [Acinetobacter beijerinckii]|uniref:DUF4124 domain-containing protein n=1 Tax=Acinetobacter beijerinckii TaxID=262668 RepID=UPI003AF7E907
MNKFIIGFSLILFSAASNAEVFQCKVNGSLVFQDKPCSGSKEQAKQIRDKQKEYKDAQDRRERDNAERAARKEPKIGMKKADAYKSSWGYPDKENVTTTSNGTNEQWVYRRGSNSKYLYFTNGVLTTIQDF